jgi:hypothetical protein
MITLLLMELLAKLGSDVDRAADKVEHVMGALTATKSASNVMVKRDVCDDRAKINLAENSDKLADKAKFNLVL